VNRNDEQLKHEVEYIKEYTQKFFCTEASKEEVEALVAEMLADRKRDYLFQRLRDWPSQGLLSLVESFAKVEEEKRLAAQVGEEPYATIAEEPKQRGRKAKVVKNSQVIT